MKPGTLILSTCILFTLLTVAWAADVDGKWTAQVPGRQGNTQEVTLYPFTGGQKTSVKNRA